MQASPEQSMRVYSCLKVRRVAFRSPPVIRFRRRRQKKDGKLAHAGSGGLFQNKAAQGQRRSDNRRGLLDAERDPARAFGFGSAQVRRFPDGFGGVEKGEVQV